MSYIFTLDWAGFILPTWGFIPYILTPELGSFPPRTRGIILRILTLGKMPSIWREGEGDSEGLTDIDNDGEMLGLILGLIEGLTDGLIDGEIEGEILGEIEADGDTLGLTEGDMEGEIEGDTLPPNPLSNNK